MAIVKITTALQAKLLQPGSLLSPSLLIQQFKHWRKNGETSNKMFAAETQTENCLSHTHMAPGNPEELAAWEFNHLKRRWGKLTSDRYLLWAFDKTYGDLLIDVIFEPDAHKLWWASKRGMLQDLQTVADNFVYFNQVP